MQINSSNTNIVQQNFTGRGKPISLEYIVKNRQHLLPQRVLEEAKTELASKGKEKSSLMDLHKKVYKELLKCATLEDAKKLFQEFIGIKDDVQFKRNSVYAKKFKEKVGNNFVLRMLQEFWGKLKSKDEVAKELGMQNRTSLEWALKNIGFVGLTPNYLNLLKASDVEGNKIIANKTSRWNKNHKEQMLEHNKKAAQACKTKKYRAAQSKRMKDYDLKHPERVHKISENNKRAWAICPEIRAALAEFTRNQSDFIKNILRKHAQGITLNEEERITRKSFYKHFWDSHPEFKKIFAEAKRKVANKKD